MIKSEGGLAAPHRHPIAWRDEAFYQQEELNKECARVFDVCHGCRRCVNLCQAFPTLFDLIDTSETMEVDGVDAADYGKVAKQCYLCDLCFMSKCPYVPPHEWAIDFPALMLRAKAVAFRQGRVTQRDKQLAAVDRNGALGSIPVINQIANKVMDYSWARRIAGIHQDAVLPKYQLRSAAKKVYDRTADQAASTQAGSSTAVAPALVPQDAPAALSPADPSTIGEPAPVLSDESIALPPVLQSDQVASPLAPQDESIALPPAPQDESIASPPAPQDEPVASPQADFLTTGAPDLELQSEPVALSRADPSTIGEPAPALSDEPVASPRDGSSTTGRLAVFMTCYGHYYDVKPVEDLIQVLEHNGVAVELIANKRCCGMPRLELGDLQSVDRVRHHHVDSLTQAIDKGCDIMAPLPSCVLMFRAVLPLLYPDDRAIKRVSRRIYDPCEYLMLRHAEGLLNTDFKNELGEVVYHLACHTRVQNFGYKTRELLSMVPGTTIKMLERCSGHDGTYGVKKDTYEHACRIGAPPAQQLKRAAPSHFTSDCILAGRHIAELSGSGLPAQHPFSLLKFAYGL